MAALTAPGTSLSELKGIGPKTIEKIEAHGISSIERLADMTPEQLTAIPGIGEKMVEKIQLSVAAHFQSLEGQEVVEGAEVSDASGDGGEYASTEEIAEGEQAETAPVDASPEAVSEATVEASEGSPIAETAAEAGTHEEKD